MFLVTGASGFLGQNLIEDLNKKEPVVALVRRKSLGKRRVGSKIIIKTGDVTDIDSLRRVAEKVSGIIHLAAVIHSENKSEFWQVNVEGTRNIVKICQERGIKRLIFLSTMNVKLKDSGFYGESKKTAEKIVAGSGLSWTIIRPTMIYGRGDQRNLARLINLVKKLPFIPVFGEGNFLLQPVYIKDLVWFIMKILNDKKSYQKDYEIGGGDVLTFNQIINYIASQVGRPKPIIHLPLLIGKVILPFLRIISKDLAFSLKGFIVQQSSLLPDVSLTIKNFSFSPCTFEEGIRKTFKS